MSWLKTVVGLIGEAVGTEAGRQVIGNVRAAIRKEPSQPLAASVADLDALITEYRTRTASSLEAIVQELNAQNERLNIIVRRQRLWNFALSVAVVVTLLIALLT